MRFFTTLQPAGRLEFLVVTASIYGLVWALLKFVLEFGFANGSTPSVGSLLEADSYAYNSGAIGLVAVGLTVLVFLSIVNAGRRLKDLSKWGGAALLMVLPVTNVLTTLYLATATAVKDTFTPYGKNPYDPNSWIAPEAATGSSGIVVEGQDIYLPGEEQQAA